MTAAAEERCVQMQAIEAAGVKAGMRVLIHAGAGGVGSLAVQMAKARGAYVITTAGTRNFEFVTKVREDCTCMRRSAWPGHGKPVHSPCSAVHACKCDAEDSITLDTVLRMCCR